MSISIGIFPNGFEGMATGPSHPPSSVHEELSAAVPALPYRPNSVTFQLGPQQQAGVLLEPAAADVLLPIGQAWITLKWRPSSLLPDNSMSTAGRASHEPSAGMASRGQNPSPAQCSVMISSPRAGNRAADPPRAEQRADPEVSTAPFAGCAEGLRRVLAALSTCP